MKNILLFITLAFFYFSCDSLITEVNPSKIPLQDPLIVVNASLSPQDSLINIIITESQPIFNPNQNGLDSTITNISNGDTSYYFYYSNKSRTIDNAEVKISNGDTEIILQFNAETESYQAVNNNFIYEGAAISLNVNVGDRAVTGATKIPIGKPQLVEYQIEKSQNTNNFGSNNNEIARVKWQDDETQDNFYYLSISYKKYYTYKYYDNNLDSLITNSYENTDSFYPTYGDGTYSDNLYNGKIMDSKLFENYVYYNPQTTLDSTKLKISILNISEDYYKYQKSINSAYYSEGNPFAEPSGIFSNIEGGLGCISAYTKTSKEYDVIIEE